MFFEVLHTALLKLTNKSELKYSPRVLNCLLKMSNYCSVSTHFRSRERAVLWFVYVSDTAERSEVTGISKLPVGLQTTLLCRVRKQRDIMTGFGNTIRAEKQHRNEGAIYGPESFRKTVNINPQCKQSHLFNSMLIEFLFGREITCKMQWFQLITLFFFYKNDHTPKFKIVKEYEALQGQQGCGWRALRAYRVALQPQGRAGRTRPGTRAQPRLAPMADHCPQVERTAVKELDFKGAPLSSFLHMAGFNVPSRSCTIQEHK